MLKMSYRLSRSISAQFAIEMLSQPEIAKISLKPLFWRFKVIYVNTNKKLVTIACYEKQHVCAYLQPFSCYTK